MMCNTYTGTPLDKNRFYSLIFDFPSPKPSCISRLTHLTTHSSPLCCPALPKAMERVDPQSQGWAAPPELPLSFLLGWDWWWLRVRSLVGTGVRSLQMSLAVKKHISYQVSGTSRGNTAFLCTQKRISGYLKQTYVVAPTADLFPSLATWERQPVWNVVVNTLIHLSQWPCKKIPPGCFSEKEKSEKIGRSKCKRSWFQPIMLQWVNWPQHLLAITLRWVIKARTSNTERDQEKIINVVLFPLAGCFVPWKMADPHSGKNLKSWSLLSCDTGHGRRNQNIYKQETASKTHKT